MEVLFLALFAVLFLLVRANAARTKKVAADVQTLFTNLGTQGEELNRLIVLVEERHATARPARATVVSTDYLEGASATVAEEMESRDGEYPRPSLDQAAQELAAEVIPGADIASFLADAAASTAPRGPSLLEQGLQKLRGTEEWEALIGGRLLNRIGAMALILGMGFFFKYAVDQNWISQGARVGIGVLVGLILLGLASRSHKRGYAILGQGLVGAGLAVLYLSVFASFNFYHLIPQPLALAGMGAITILAFAQSLAYDSLAVSLLACAGGYLTPFLLEAGSSSPVGTIAYVFLLDLGTLAVLNRRRMWTILEPIALCATYLVYASWYLTSYSSDRALLAGVAVTAFWALFLAFDAYGLLKFDDAANRLRLPMGAINGIAYYGSIFALAHMHRGTMALLTVGIGAVYVAVLLTLRHYHSLSVQTAVRFTLTATILLIVATAVRFTGFTLVILWSLEALPLVWYGTRRKLWYVWRPALVVYALATGLLFATGGSLMYEPIGDFRLLLNERALAFLLLAGALAASSISFRRLRGNEATGIVHSLQSAWVALIFVLLTVETVDLFRHLMVNTVGATRSGLQFSQVLAVAAVWMVYSIALVTAGWRRRTVVWLCGGAGSGIGALVLGAIASLEYVPLSRYTPIINIRAGLLVLLIGALAFHLKQVTRQRDSFIWLREARIGLQLAMVLFGFELLSVEINDTFQRQVGHPLPSMDVGAKFVELAMLAAVWMIYSLLPAWYGVRKRSMPLLALGLTMAASATGVAAFAGIVFQPSTQFALLLGMRPVILSIIVTGLLIQLRWLRATRSTDRWIAQVLVAIQAAIILLGFGLLTAETRDIFTQHIATATGDSANTWRDLERLAFSLVWLGYAILVLGLGIWRRARWMRLGAITLFAFIILKVFIYDLSFLGAVYRPISFAGLGVILLVVSYLYGRYRSILLQSD